MQFIFIVKHSYSDSKTNTPVLKYTVTMSTVVMTVKLIPLYQKCTVTTSMAVVTVKVIP